MAGFPYYCSFVLLAAGKSKQSASACFLSCLCLNCVSQHIVLGGCCYFCLPRLAVFFATRVGGPLSRMGGGKNGSGGRGAGGFFGMARANVTNVDKNAKDKVSSQGCLANCASCA